MTYIMAFRCLIPTHLVLQIFISICTLLIVLKSMGEGRQHRENALKQFSDLIPYYTKKECEIFFLAKKKWWYRMATQN